MTHVFKVTHKEFELIYSDVLRTILRKGCDAKRGDEIVFEHADRPEQKIAASVVAVLDGGEFGGMSATGREPPKAICFRLRSLIPSGDELARRCHWQTADDGFELGYLGESPVELSYSIERNGAGVVCATMHRRFDSDEEVDAFEFAVATVPPGTRWTQARAAAARLLMECFSGLVQYVSDAAKQQQADEIRARLRREAATEDAARPGTSALIEAVADRVFASLGVPVSDPSDGYASRGGIARFVEGEMAAADAKWGAGRDHQFIAPGERYGLREAEAKDRVRDRVRAGDLTWADILVEEVAEAIEAGQRLRESQSIGNRNMIRRSTLELCAELVQVSAVAQLAIESLSSSILRPFPAEPDEVF